MITLLLLAILQEPTLTAPTVDKAPTLDGKGDDACWEKAKELKVAVADAMEPANGRNVVTLKAVRCGDELFVMMTWKDESESAQHKPWVWDKEKKEYIEGSDIEDSAMLGFALSGEFDANMLAGVESTWDAWHWKAARTNPAGLAQDRRHIYTLKKPEIKAMKYKSLKGNDVWIARPEDEGKSVTAKAAKPAAMGEKVVAQFVARAAEKSAGDIRAKGAWKDGSWTVEFARKLDTGHADDAAFAPGKPVAMAVAVLDASEESHSVSGKLQLVVEK
jgi:hypothetical protein